MAYFNGQHFPFILTNTGGGGSAYRVKYYEEINEEQKALEIAYLQGLINSESDFSIEVVLGSSIYPAAYTLTDGVIDIFYISEYDNGFYFIHCAPAANELVYGFQKWYYLSYNEQTLSDTEKTKARENIGALGSGDITGLPAVTTSDNDKFLRVVDGAWAAVAVGTAEETSF